MAGRLAHQVILLACESPKPTSKLEIWVRVSHSPESTGSFWESRTVMPRLQVTFASIMAQDKLLKSVWQHILHHVVELKCLSTSPWTSSYLSLEQENCPSKLGRISWITKFMSHLEKSWEREVENGSEDPQYGVSFMCLKKMEEN